MTGWSASDDLERLVLLNTSRRRDAYASRTRRRRDEIAAQFSARGLSQSGAFYVAIAEDCASTFKDEYGGLIADLLGLAADLENHPASMEWLLARYNEVVDGTSKGIAESLRQLTHRPPGTEASLVERVTQSAWGLKRDAEIAFGRVKLRESRAGGRVVPTPPSQAVSRRDFFICHAGEDKELIASPIAAELTMRGHAIWFDTYELTLGDSLLQKIQRGLVDSRFGVVILSPSFFEKPWPLHELDGLAARGAIERRKVILPVWHNIGVDEIARRSPSLAGVVGIPSSMGVAKVADAIESALRADDTETRALDEVKRGAPFPLA